MIERTLQFRFEKNGLLLDTTETTFTAARRIGAHIADEYGRVQMYAYNDALYRWDHIGDFIGCHRFISSLEGEEMFISDDYSRIIKKGGEL